MEQRDTEADGLRSQITALTGQLDNLAANQREADLQGEMESRNLRLELSRVKEELTNAQSQVRPIMGASGWKKTLGLCSGGLVAVLLDGLSSCLPSWGFLLLLLPLAHGVLMHDLPMSLSSW